LADRSFWSFRKHSCGLSQTARSGSGCLQRWTGCSSLCQATPNSGFTPLCQTTPDSCCTPDSCYTPDCSPLYTPDCSPLYTPDCSPLYTPDCSPLYTPDCSPLCKTTPNSCCSPDCSSLYKSSVGRWQRKVQGLGSVLRNERVCRQQLQKDLLL